MKIGDVVRVNPNHDGGWYRFLHDEAMVVVEKYRTNFGTPCVKVICVDGRNLWDIQPLHSEDNWPAEEFLLVDEFLTKVHGSNK